MRKASSKNPSTQKAALHDSFEWSPRGSIATFRKHLLRWYDVEKRILPFRDIDDPYGVWISEIMLQQTQVDRVCDFWQRFMQRFPTVQTLAAAPEEAVLAAWEGLGYYRRARFLHAAAQMIVANFDGHVPSTPEDLATLPGLGPYTTASVASIAFGVPVAVVDANVVRVLSRLCGYEGDVSIALAKTALAQTAQTLLANKRVGDWNQAVMELGAMICSPTMPACDVCPVREHCRGYAAGDPERFPARAKSMRTKTLHEVALVMEGPGGFFFEQRPHDGLWPNLWTFPHTTINEKTPPEKAACDMLAAWGLNTSPGQQTAVTYAVTTRRVTLTYFHIKLNKKAAAALPAGTTFCWSPDANSLALAAPHRRILQKCQASHAKKR